ncbi:hypothetical protein G6F40_017000 [Rhizopus arrhizus]|nr:hypothetical protein G6F40_017000 [Rhizopus arrhizus]
MLRRGDGRVVRFDRDLLAFLPAAGAGDRAVSPDLFERLLRVGATAGAPAPLDPVVAFRARHATAALGVLRGLRVA